MYENTVTIFGFVANNYFYLDSKNNRNIGSSLETRFLFSFLTVNGVSERNK